MLSFIFLMPSCVSKKKFVEMTKQRTEAEKRVVSLHEENGILKDDFENYKVESGNDTLSSSPSEK